MRIAAPTHPLYLWHYARYAEIVNAQRDRLDDRDRVLVAQAAERLPFFLTSIFIPSTAASAEANLMYLSRLGPLPVLRARERGRQSNDGPASVRALVEAQLALEPHSQRGYRLGLIDPPDAGAYLSMLADLADEGKLSGAHLTIYRHPRSRVGVELRLDEAEEDRSRGSSVRSPPPALHVRDPRSAAAGTRTARRRTHHLVVAFDQSTGQMNPPAPRCTRSSRWRSPVGSPIGRSTRRWSWSPHRVVRSRTTTSWSGGSPRPGTSYLAVHRSRRSCARRSTRSLSRVPWTAVADRQVDRDLRIGEMRIMTARDGERVVAGFARSTVPFRRPLRDVVREYNAYISNEDLDDLLEQLSDLLDAGILNLRPDASGKTNFNRIKGLLGTLIAARWFRKSGDDATRLLVSLDGAEARRWLHLSDDPYRARDLVGFTWTNDHCTVSVIEVKAVQVKGTEYGVDNGVVSGAAIDQMLSTRRLLEQVFAHNRDDQADHDPGAPGDPARAPVPRVDEGGIQALNDAKLLADRLQRLLDGAVTRPTSLPAHRRAAWRRLRLAQRDERGSARR